MHACPIFPGIHLNGIPLPHLQRGHYRGPCFFAEDEYFRYLPWLAEALAESECQLHAHALMTSHVHLFLDPKKAAAVPRLLMLLGVALRAIPQLHA